MIQITPSAAQEIKRIQRSRQATDSYLRITVQSGGCLDYIYQFSLDAEPQSGDRQETIRNINILINHNDAEQLKDLSIDYSEDLMGGSFRFKNPHTIKTCNCGQSFQKEP
ncbi:MULTISPECIES: iron-sulfur cluster assembly accessory protein [Cyanophyceae]|uniref:HesB/IscA family protein n=1 Tax=Cyanophyceae TaxID=3028117 RepID=UPI00016DCC2A|nr:MULTISPECIES: iron-sulfur cluster assembly accessory protein [Cyanophyceae]ACB00052.1 HesB-like domain protein [Picosynechococcus sp. PCC 7002]SMH53895.1 Iron-sulfur cluster assembly accessory protein [Picosynechococcus sp. OG1]SMQ82801.1 Iron-sulfur cluster assembly accessory protein [Synechococcus sp. 7002]